MIYLIILIALLIFSYMYDYRQHSRGRMVAFVAVIISFILLGGLRYRIGSDTINYIYDFYFLPPLDRLSTGYFSATRYAMGYVVLTSFLRQFTSDFVIVQLVHATFVNCVVGWFFYKNTRHIFFAQLLFFFLCFSLMVFQQMRESFAVSFFLLAWPAFREGKWIKWYLLSACAMMFHVSATVMLILPLFTLPWVRNLFVFGKKIWVVCACIFAVGILIQTMFFKYLQILAISDAITDRAAVYSNTNYGSSLWIIGGVVGVLQAVARYVLYPVLALYFLIKIRKDDELRLSKQFKRMEFMVLMSIYVGVFSIAVPIWSRFNNYFYFFPMVIISDFVYSYIIVGRKWIRLKILYWWMCFIPLFALHFYVAYWGAVNKSGTLRSYMTYYPYSSYLDKERDQNRENIYSYQKTLWH